MFIEVGRFGNNEGKIVIILEKVVSLQRKHKGDMEDKDKTMASEPAAASLSKSVVLTKEMQKAAHQAERDLESGKCLNEDAFQKRFAKWL